MARVVPLWACLFAEVRFHTRLWFSDLNTHRSTCNPFHGAVLKRERWHRTGIHHRITVTLLHYLWVWTRADLVKTNKKTPLKNVLDGTII